MTTTNIDEQSSPNELQRKLSNRHLQLIAIGGAIGTGLFMGSGKTISLAGPSIIIIYMIIGAMFFFLMRALGEILLSNLHYKSLLIWHMISLDQVQGIILVGPIGWDGFWSVLLI